MVAAITAVLSELDGVFTFKEQKNKAVLCGHVSALILISFSKINVKHSGI